MEALRLSAGSRLGPYELVAHLGTGGMGEVYLARDSRLGREVAIKVLRPELARNPEHLARFEREARMLAALNHPNVGVIYGLEEFEGVRFLVLEYVPGPTLAERAAAGALPLDEVLRTGRRIAAALAAAHARGIVHRDLKTLNVKVTPEGTVKVLDFGLAKAVASSTDATLGPGSPTLGTPVTKAGMVLGTLATMSPEQARGLAVDTRTDIWALGCVVFEMLSGREPFSAGTAADTIAGILERQPDWSALPASTPPALVRLLKVCLEKDPARRPAAADEVARELRRIAREPQVSQGGGDEPRAVHGPFRIVAAVGRFIRGGAPRQRRPEAGTWRPPRLAQVTFGPGIASFAALSPEARDLVYSADVGSVRKLFRARADGSDPSQLTTGPHDDIQPTHAPDGASVLFVRSRDPGRRLEPADVFGQYTGADLWALELASGRETRLLDDANNPAFSPDGKRIAVDASWAGPRRVWVVDRRGRNPVQVTSDSSEAVVHLRPRWSPDGTRIVFQNLERTKFDLRVVEVAGGRLSWLTDDLFQDLNPVWSPSGRLVFFSSNRGGGLNVWALPVTPEGAPDGPPRQLTTGAGQDVEIAASGDGRTLAFSILRQNADLWRLPVDPASGLATGPPQSVVASSREESRGAWSPDGNRIAFNCDRSGDMNIWIHTPADGSLRQLTRGPGGDYQPNWAPDGRTLAFFSSRNGSPGIWTADAETGRLTPLTRDRHIEVNPFFSPDGRRIAFQSDRAGRLEVWVMDADGGGARQLTSVGASGHFLRWSADGRWIVFRCPAGGASRTMRVAVEGGDPEATAEVQGGAHMSFSPDGSRVMDVVNHKTLWVSPLAGGSPQRVFEFEDPGARIDYPVWSPDGRWVLFDRFLPQGGDVWVMRDFD